VWVSLPRHLGGPAPTPRLVQLGQVHQPALAQPASARIRRRRPPV